MGDDYLSASVSAVGEATYTLAGEEDSDAPAVFFCVKCRLPLGDSFSWSGTDEQQNHILLRRVSNNVAVGREPLFAGKYKKMGCVIRTLSCLGCSSPIGIMYVSTPKELDHRRSLFSMDVARIDSYVVGSSTQQRATLSSEKTPVTLEYREGVQQQLNEVKALTVAIGQRLSEIEANLQNKSV
ncbi:hypothetical protein AALO_G00090990 [Alosa alosa]|uniref:Protein Mis18-alpha n=1 Tax=Alosa alosa TaxID=278164 RepID=A0AAV6GVT2_9TELE|nr:protein Mis18-alpha [Alosa alosa]XP_048103744.1 protein Mis18-alpha [Alosa alosa]XP_048103745.1 protein Mis18-alpha [Alosa alosa]XP_048103746.1 protein Mis18-alpha [Alosa alosa]XP_048103747.1 protein Mis18-alpha [Alosa alosa]KAG5277752.1 hypothetical protein AALO_G00090990 [Alosa alosa]